MASIDFILGKLNLLVLGGGLFAIFVFVVADLQPEACNGIANNLASRILNEVATVGGTESLCLDSSFTIPRVLNCPGETSSGVGLFYKVRLKAVESSVNKELFNYSVVIVPRNDESMILGARSIDLNAAPKFYDWNPSDARAGIGGAGTSKPFEATENTLILDPQSAPLRVDSFRIIKETFEGNNSLYVIACTSGGEAVCSKNVQCVGCDLASSRNKTASCFEAKTTCTKCS